MRPMLRPLLLPAMLLGSGPAPAQVPPTPAEVAAYRDLHAAAARDDADAIRRLAAAGAYLNARDGNGRTPLHVAVFQGHRAAARTLLASGADPALLDHQRYDAVTVAAVRDDAAMVEALIAGGASAKLVTSVYDGTALIAAAHLGHDGVVRELIARRRAARPCQQSRLDGAHRGRDPRARRAPPSGDGAGARRGRRRRQHRRPPRRDAARACAFAGLRRDGRDTGACGRALTSRRSGRAARERQPDAAADEHRPGGAPEEARAGRLHEPGPAEPGGDAPGGVGRPPPSRPRRRTSWRAGTPPAETGRRTAAGRR